MNCRMVMVSVIIVSFERNMTRGDDVTFFTASSSND